MIHFKTMFKVTVGVFLMLVICFTSLHGKGITTCLSCNDAIQPRDCTTIERCGPFSTCYTEAYVTSLGYPRFNLGCRDIVQCQSLTTKKRAGSLLYCDECCVGNLCNQDGCNQTGFVAPNIRGPICFDCSTQQTTNDCQNIKICRIGEVCKLKRMLYGPNDEIRYESSCEYQKTCTDEVSFYQPAQAIGKRSVQEFLIGDTCMIQCCGTDLCNTGCTKQSGTMSTTALPSPVKKPSIDSFIPNAAMMFHKLGSRISLACDSVSFPEPNIVWTGSFSFDYSLSINRTNITISALQPSQIGNYTCTVSNKYGSTSRTLTITSNVSRALDCDFETARSCLWTNNQLDDGEWVNSMLDSVTATLMLTPEEVKETGNFLFTSVNTKMYDSVVDLISPQLGVSEPSCLSFLYHIHPYDKVNLQVQVEANCVFNMPCNSPVPLTVILYGREGYKGWQMALIPVPAVTSRHRIVIKSIQQQDNAEQGFTAIDKIRYYTGTCKQTVSLYGPRYVNLTIDHGSPLQIDCSINGYPKPFYTWSKIDGCGSFTNVTDASVVITQHASQGDSGTYICSAENSGPYNLDVKQTFFVNIISPINDNCTFEDGICGWRQLIGDTFDWIRNSGPTLSLFTGPDADHTTENSKDLDERALTGALSSGSLLFTNAAFVVIGRIRVNVKCNGTYLYVDASSPRLSGDTAILRSPRQASKTPICFSFYYHMYGNDTGRLEVNLKDTCSGHLLSVFNKTGNQGEKWLYHSIDISAKYIPNDYFIHITAIIGKSYHGDIAIDDISVRPGTCLIKR